MEDGEAQLLKLDRTFNIELQWMRATASDLGAAKLQEWALEKCLPGSDKHDDNWTVPKCKAALDKLMMQELYLFLDPGQQGALADMMCTCFP